MRSSALRRSRPSYFSLRARIPESSVEQVEHLLYQAGAIGLEIRDSRVLPMPRTVPLPAGTAAVTGFFEGKDKTESARAQLRRSMPDSRLRVALVPTEDWSSSWRSRIRSVEVGRLWVGPPWEAHRAPTDRIPIAIEPKMAFGTGDHPTTSLCLEAIDAHFTPGRGGSLLDVGTGSGVLAIAAGKLGAGRVLGVDSDPVAVATALENAKLNRVKQVKISDCALNELVEAFDLVVANILANTLVELSSDLARLTARKLVLSGLLIGQENQVARAFRQSGLTLSGRRTRKEWLRLDFRRR